MVKGTHFVILDQDQAKWFVGEGDPSFLACQLLSATFSPNQIVLPRSIIQGEETSTPAKDLTTGIQRIERAWANTGDEDLRLEYLHRVRLFDCLYVLENGVQ